MAKKHATMVEVERPQSASARKNDVAARHATA
jgi:hypothetical protein